jgi:hypothetical protein
VYAVHRIAEGRLKTAQRAMHGRWLGLILLLTAAAAESTSAPRQRLFYIYEDLPLALSDTWPSRSISLTPQTVWKHAFSENEGFGQHYADTAYYETWQYASFKVILSRMLRSSHRTYNASEASLFFIPYDTGSECYVDHRGEYRNIGNPMADIANPIFKNLTYLKRNHGYDHFMVHGSSLVAHKVSHKLRDLMQMCFNVTILTVERLPRLHHFLSSFPFVQPVPMVSMYHWQKQERKNSIPALHITTRINYIAFFGSIKTG